MNTVNFIVILIEILLYISISISAKSSSSTASSSSSDLGRRRILSELREIRSEGLSFDVPFNSSSSLECGIRLGPHHNLLEWHFSFTGIADTPFSKGIYHGRIRLPKNYPRSAPSICMITPNGRWEVGKDICLSATAHNQETWTPQWNLRTLIMALRGHIITQPREIGSIVTTAERQLDLAILSQKFRCPLCGIQHEHLLQSKNNDKCTSNNNEITDDKKLTAKIASSLSSKQIKKLTKKMKEVQKKQYEIYISKKKKMIRTIATGLFLFMCFAVGFLYQSLQIYGFTLNMITEEDKIGLKF